LSSKKYVLCVIANDAKTNDGQYTDVGRNFKLRADESWSWTERSLLNVPIVWAFGAGTDEAHARGPTLGMLAEAYLRTKDPSLVALTNRRDKEYYGTLEEIYWVVKKAQQTFKGEKLQFVFFTQRRHMWRVKIIWWLFYQKEFGNAMFVTTGQTSQLSLLHEIGGMLKVWRVYRGKEKPRYKMPYR